MKKLGHKETKTGNQLLILQTILSGNGLSRIELAEKTQLSPSTVTSLTADLLKRGIIEESGTKIITAGRARTELTVSNSLGYLLVLEISHGCIYITTLSMRLKILSTRQIRIRFMDGNSIFSAVAKEIVDVPRAEPLAGIGILFQEDVREQGFHVMYSTGYEAANISLKDALKTQFRVPVLEDSVAEADAAKRPRANHDAGRQFTENGRQLEQRSHHASQLCGENDDADLQHQKHHFLDTRHVEVRIGRNGIPCQGRHGG